MQKGDGEVFVDEKGRKGRREIVRRVMKVWEWEIREKERVGLCGIVGEGLEREREVVGKEMEE